MCLCCDEIRIAFKFLGYMVVCVVVACCLVKLYSPGADEYAKKELEAEH